MALQLFNILSIEMWSTHPLTLNLSSVSPGQIESVENILCQFGSTGHNKQAVLLPVSCACCS